MKDVVFHIGHHKTATSWLQDYYFSKHPDIHVISNYCFPWTDSFLHYLVTTSERKFSVARCRETFQENLLRAAKNSRASLNLVTAERLSGAPYSGGYDSFIIARRLQECFPKARIILGIRNQVDMIRSFYKQQIREGYTGRFSDFIYTPPSWSGTAFTLDMLEYDLLIAKYYELFSPDRCLILVYEDFVQKPVDVLDNISRFLGIGGYTSADIGKKINKSRNDSKIRRRRFLNHFQKSEMNPFPLLTLSARSQKVVYRLLSPLYSLFSQPLISAADIEYVKEYYRIPNQRLRQLLGRNLPEYP